MKKYIKAKYSKTHWYKFIQKQLIKFRVWTYRNLTDVEFVKKDFRYIYGYDLDIEHPKGYHEVISWYKTTDLLRSYHPYADKYEMRKYITEKIGEQYLVPLIAVWESYDEVDLGSLPERYVIIPSHMSGNKIIQDGTLHLSKKKMLKDIKKWFGTNFYDFTREPQYRDMKPRVLVYEYLEEESGDLPDYKYFMINHELYMIFNMMFRKTQVRTVKYDANWKPMEELNSYRTNLVIIDKPDFADEMEELANILAEDFPFVRVDFYHANGHTYVGELTFTHGDSRSYFDIPEFNEEVGSSIFTALKSHMKELT